MKTYNITLDAAQPVRKVLAVPANTQKFGVVVKAENIDGSSLTCSMVDGSETIEATRQEDGTFIFELSSSGQESDREVKIVLEKEAVNIGGLSSEGGGFKNVALFELPAGKYTNKDLVDVGVKLHTAVTAQIGPKNSADSVNLVGFQKVLITGTGIASFAVGGKPIADDVVVEVLAPTVFGVFKSVSDNPYISPDIYLGTSVTSYHDVTLNETRYAIPDGEIEVQDPDIVVDSVTIDGETYPVEWRAITIDGEPVVVLAAKVETPESSDSELDSTDTELDSNDSELTGD